MAFSYHNRRGQGNLRLCDKCRVLQAKDRKRVLDRADLAWRDKKYAQWQHQRERLAATVAAVTARGDFFPL